MLEILIFFCDLFILGTQIYGISKLMSSTRPLQHIMCCIVFEESGVLFSSKFVKEGLAALAHLLNNVCVYIAGWLITCAIVIM